MRLLGPAWQWDLSVLGRVRPEPWGLIGTFHLRPRLLRVRFTWYLLLQLGGKVRQIHLPCASGAVILLSPLHCG